VSHYDRAVRLVVRHTYDFGPDRERIGRDLLRPEAWDAARATAGAFGLPSTRSAWEGVAARDDLRAVASDVVALATQLGTGTLCSHGVGTAMLELNIHRLAPDLHLICTDFARQTVERLRVLFPEAEILLRDLVHDEPPHADLHLMHRLDAELSDEAWRHVFERLPEPVLFVPNLLLDLRTALGELARRLRGRRLTRAGWFRNEAALRALWHSTHTDRRLRVGSTDAFLLEPR
jgi:hypothetical protein